MKEYHPDVPLANNPLQAEPADRTASPPASLEVGGEGGRDSGPLVLGCISERKMPPHPGNPVALVEIYPRGVRLIREKIATLSSAGIGGKRADISSFTNQSKRRLRWCASNASPALVSQFGMTYHNANPDGRTCKKHLHAFLVALRRKYGRVGYLWILEFQSRKVAHFHLWLTLPQDTEGLHEFLASTWHRIAEPESEWHDTFHRRRKNFIQWSMQGGSYLCKYLEKEYQKAVPEGFTGLGRFWGASLNLVPPPDVLEASQVDNPAFLVRTLCRHHEASLRWSKWKSRARHTTACFRLPNGAIIVRRILTPPKGADFP